MDLPLGTYVGNPNGNDARAEAAFQQAFASFASTVGRTPTMMNAFLDYSQDPSQWASNVQWTAWSWAQSPVARNMVPVFGAGLTSNAGGWANASTFFADVVDGKYDDAYGAIPSAWFNAGFKKLYVRLGYEHNGTFMPWYAGNDPAGFTAAFAHVAKLLHSTAPAGMDLKTVWCPTTQNWSSFDVAGTTYPGSDVVDVVGVDCYSPCYPLDLTNWSSTPISMCADMTAWSAMGPNRRHFWDASSANQWNPKGQPGVGFTLADAITLAKREGKPLMVCESGAANQLNPTSTQGVGDPLFPLWLGTRLRNAGVPIEGVMIWDVDLGDGGWSFSATHRAGEAASWRKAFGPA